MSDEGRRTLSCIMFTDMAGYTALSQSDESQTLKLLERHNELVRPFFQKRKGKEIKTIGDSFLVEFESALDAVECAIEIQKFLHDYNISSLEEWRIHLRIGIHLGDVIHKGRDLFGDTVNIASRIEPLSEVDGVALTRQVYDHIQNKIRAPMESLGFVPLKNVVQSVEVFKVIMPWNENGHPQAKLASRIAVLPFANMSPDANDEYFADGLTEELIDRLSQIKGLEVIARTSVMTYKNKGKKISEIGKELRVGSVIEGSVRKAGNKIRATVNLIDSNSESRLWSSRYDKDLDDIFAIQSDIASNVTGAIPASLGLEIRGAAKEEKKDTEDVIAYTYFLQARELLHGTAEASVRDALNLLEKAIKRDPKFARAYVEKAQCYRSLATYAHIPFQQAIDEARKAVQRALEIDDSLAEAHAALSAIEMMEDNLEEGEIEARRAVELNPNLADAYSNLASILSSVGDLQESIKLRERAYELDPLEPWNMSSLGDEYFWCGRESEALEMWNTALKFAPYMTYDSMMDYLINKGEYAKAANTLALLRNLEPGNPENDFWDGYLAAVAGNLERAKEMINELEKSAGTGAVTINGIALIYLALGDLDRYFEVERKANETHRLSVSVVRYSPLAAKARSDPRMMELLEKFERKVRL